MEFFLKSRSLQLSSERTSSKVFSSKIYEIFQNSFLLEQLSVNAFLSGALSKQ